MKIIAHGNGHEYTVNHIEFKKDGTIKHISGFMEWNGKKDYPIGAHADHMDLYKNIALTITRGDE